jgi:3-deoxy-D-manno-octulosonate 8-phosphate phosphatase (KDO 8-P phosphatase)
MKPSLRRRLVPIRALALDVDGVLTDGGLYYGAEGDVLKKFNVKDGLGLRRLLEAGVAVAFITGEETEIVRRRAAKLRVADVYTGVGDKAKALDDFLARRGLPAAACAFMGDDLTDLPAMRRAGFSFAPADAAPEVRKAAHHVTRLGGGEGAVREVCDAILAARA